MSVRDAATPDRGSTLDFELLLVILVDGLVYSSYLFLVAVGLTVIFGVQKVLNVTHGAFYSFGAYLTAYLIGLWINDAEGGAFELLAFSLAVILIGSVFLGIVLGVLFCQDLGFYHSHYDLGSPMFKDRPQSPQSIQPQSSSGQE